MTALIDRVGFEVDGVDLYCGYGGSSTGIHKAGVTVRAAANHNPLAIEVHAANFPDTDHWRADLVNEDASDYVDVRDLPRARFLWASPSCKHHSKANAQRLYKQGHQGALPGLGDDDDFDDEAYANSERSRVSMSCFPGDVLVLTNRGLVPISDVAVGDQVLTHRNRWRPVMAKASRLAETVTVRGRGHYGIETTENHPFYVRPNGRVTKNRRSVRQLGAPEWRPAGQLQPVNSGNYGGKFDGWFWATPSALPELPVPPIHGTRAVEQDEAFWYVVGRWLGDGSLRFNSAGRGLHVHIACHTDEADELAKRLAILDWRWNRKAPHGQGCVFEMCHQALVEWLVEHFGQHAHGKRLPTWVLGMSRSHRSSLLDGYASADGTLAYRGSTQSAQWTTTTVSKALAIGVRLLAESLGYGASLMTTPRRAGRVLDGKPFMARRQYLVRWGENTISARTVNDAHLRWSKVRDVAPTGRQVEVFDIEVDEDHSFVADGLVVHNCVLRYVEHHRPELAIVENVIEVTKWGPNQDGTMFKWWLGVLDNLGYNVQPCWLNSMFFGVPQSRDRVYFVCSRKGNPLPDVDYRPPATCTSDACQGARVEAVQTWKRRTKAWMLPTWGRYNDQYTYTCPDCRARVHPDVRPASDIIDWSIPATPIGDRKKPLAPATRARILAGLQRYGWAPVVTAGAGNVYETTAGNRARPVTRPLATQPTTATHALATVPGFLFNTAHGGRVVDLDQPHPTVCAFDDRHHLVIPLRNKGRARTTDEPITTLCASGGHHALVMRNNTGGPEMLTPVTEPVRTITTAGHQSLLVPYYGNGTAQTVARPVPTVTTHDRCSLVTAGDIDVRDLDSYVDQCRYRMLEADPEIRGASGFAPTYVLLGTKKDIVEGLGNAVSPPPAEWLTGRAIETLRGAA